MTPKRKAAKRPPKVKTIERSIQFFRIDAGADDSGKPLSYDPSKMLDDLHGRPFDSTTAGGRYVGQPDGDDYCGWVDVSTGMTIGGFETRRLRFARLRRSAIPQTEDGGQLSPIQLAARGSLYEATHMVFRHAVFHSSFEAPNWRRDPLRRLVAITTLTELHQTIR